MIAPAPFIALLVVAAALQVPHGIDAETIDEPDSIIASTTDQAGSQGASTSGWGAGDRWVRHALCINWLNSVGDLSSVRVTTNAAGMPTCAGSAMPSTMVCDDGAAPLEPWLVSRLGSDGSYGPWALASGYQCAADLLLAQVEQAWARMPIAPNTYDVEPATGYALWELGVNLVVDTNPRTLDVTLMGTPVTIRAVPTQYVWTNTDGTTWTSTSPGKPYALGGTPFTFARAPEHRTTFTLTTTWRGEFTTDGGATWRDAPGTATTTSGSTPVHVYNPHAHLVDCDLDGNCNTGDDGAGNQKTILDPDGDGIDNYLIPDNQINDYLATRDAGRTWTGTDRKG